MSTPDQSTKSQPIALYVLGLKDNPGYIKVGITSNVTARLAELSTASAFDLDVLATLYFPSRREAQANERAVHRELRSFRLRGEWFHLDPVTLATLLSLMSEVVH